MIKIDSDGEIGKVTFIKKCEQIFPDLLCVPFAVNNTYNPLLGDPPLVTMERNNFPPTVNITDDPVEYVVDVTLTANPVQLSLEGQWSASAIVPDPLRPNVTEPSTVTSLFPVNIPAYSEY